MKTNQQKFLEVMATRSEKDLNRKRKKAFAVYQKVLELYKPLIAICTMFYMKLWDMMLKAEMKNKIAVLAEIMVQQIMDKVPVEHILGTEISFGAYDVEKELAKVDALRDKLLEAGWTSRDINSLRAGIKHVNKHVLSTTWLRGNRVGPKDFDAFVAQVQHYFPWLNTKEVLDLTVKNPFDDPRFWGEVEEARKEYEIESESETIDPRSGYSKVRIQGFALRDGDKYHLYRADDEALSKIKGNVRIKLRARLFRTADLYTSEIARTEWAVVKEDEDEARGYIRSFGTPVKVVKRKGVYEVQMGSREDFMGPKNSDPFSQSSVNDIGNIVVHKDSRWVFGELQTRANPWSMYAGLKRCAFTAFSHAARLDDPLRLVDWSGIAPDKKPIEALYSSTQARIAVVPDYEGLPVPVSNIGKVYLVSRSFFERCSKGDRESFKVIINALKNKGLAYQLVDDPVMLVNGKVVPVDIIMESQGDRDLVAAMLGMGTQLAEAYLAGKDAVVDPFDIEASTSRLISSTIYGKECVFIVGEASIDNTVDRAVKVRSKRILYAQCKCFSPIAFQRMYYLYDRHARKYNVQLSRTMQNIAELEKICTWGSGRDRKYWADAEEFAIANRGKTMQTSGSLKRFLSYTQDEKDFFLTWRDTDLPEEAVRLAYDAVNEPVYILGAKINPVSLVVPVDGKYKVSPEASHILKMLHYANRVSEAKEGGDADEFERAKETYVKVLFDQTKTLLEHYTTRTSFYLKPEIDVVSGRSVTGKFRSGVVIPFKKELVARLMTQGMKVKYEDALEWVENHNLYEVNDLFKKLRFNIWRDPILKEVPTVTVQFAVLSTDVIIVGYKTALWIGSDDDDDIVSIFWKGFKKRIKLPS
mgnify:CR=1 FL=1